MLILLIFWCLLFVITIVITEWRYIKTDDIFMRFLLGLAVLSGYLHLWAIFLPVKYSLLPVILLTGIFLINPNLRTPIFTTFLDLLKHTNIYGYIVLLVVLSIASFPSFFNDDGAYYQQTIKWFSSYGFVPGLANLKMHLGLGSAWHLLSSAFYQEEFPVTRYYNFNGLLLWLFIISLLRKEKFQLITLTIVLFVGCIFVNSPSPDLLIAIVTFWILLNYKDVDMRLLAIIIGFLITVKITAAGLLFFFVPLYRKINTLRLGWQISLPLMAFIFILIIRNIILTGYPMFPLHFTGGFGTHQVPDIIIDMFRQDVILEIYDRFSVNLSHYDIINNYGDRFKALFAVRPYKVLMNLLCVLSFIITPLLLLRRQNVTDKILAGVILLNGIFWFWQAPNYRFVLGYVIFMFFVIQNQIPVVNKLSNHKGILFSITLIAVSLFIFNSASVLYQVSCGEKNSISFQQIIYPVPYNNIAYDTMDGFVITNCPYCYNAPLPCYSEGVLNSYVRKYNYEIVYTDMANIRKGFKMIAIDNKNRQK